MDEKIIDDAFQAKEEEIKAVVAEVVAAEKGIEEHRQGIANLTVALVVARYRLGSLLMSLPGAAGNLKQAKGAWLKKAVELCGNRDRVYGSRDVANYFDDPFDSAIRASGTTGEERAAAFHGTLAELEQLVRYKRDHDASERKREREEAERAASRQGTALVQGAVARVAAGAPEEHDYFGLLRKMREEAGTAADRRKPAAVQGERQRGSREGRPARTSIPSRPTLTSLNPKLATVPCNSTRGLRASPATRKKGRTIAPSPRPNSSACSATTFSRPLPT